MVEETGVHGENHCPAASRDKVCGITYISYITPNIECPNFF
jgi:hypothetical protein